MANAIRRALVLKNLAYGFEGWERWIQREVSNRDPKLVPIAGKIVVNYTKLRQDFSYQSEPLARMVKGETLRKIMINSPGRVTISIMDDLNFCVDYMIKTTGKSSIYRLI